MLTKIDKLVIVLIVLAALISLPLVINASSGSQGHTIIVLKSGKRIASYNLNDERQVKITGSYGGYCLLKIKDGQAFISESTCPIKICQKQGRISETGRSIICAPMRLMFEIMSEQGGSLDAVNE